MRKFIMLSLALIVAVPTVGAADLFEWVEESMQRGKAVEAADSASLLTLEEKESEMYPKLSPNGKYMLTLTRKGKESWISRRYTENGDPANMVTYDVRTVESIGWKDNGHVYYLSDRAGGLGVWEKISDGEGMQRRIQQLQGSLTQPILLSDESIIAVRARPLNYKPMSYKPSKTKKSSRDPFNNWDVPEYRTEIVRFMQGGREQVLAEGINPALSPDGKSIVFAMAAGRSMHLFRVNVDGSNLVQLTDARSIDAQPAWSADGKWILFTSNRADADLRHKGKSQWDIWAIGTDGRHLTRITFDKGRDGAPQMGRDGRIYFHSDRKVSRDMRKAHQVKSVGSHDFHIWSISMPAVPKH